MNAELKYVRDKEEKTTNHMNYHIITLKREFLCFTCRLQTSIISRDVNMTTTSPVIDCFVLSGDFLFVRVTISESHPFVQHPYVHHPWRKPHRNVAVTMTRVEYLTKSRGVTFMQYKSPRLASVRFLHAFFLSTPTRGLLLGRVSPPRKGLG